MTQDLETTKKELGELKNLVVTMQSQVADAEKRAADGACAPVVEKDPSRAATPPKQWSTNPVVAINDALETIRKQLKDKYSNEKIDASWAAVQKKKKKVRRMVPSDERTALHATIAKAEEQHKALLEAQAEAQAELKDAVGAVFEFRNTLSDDGPHMVALWEAGMGTNSDLVTASLSNLKNAMAVDSPHLLHEEEEAIAHERVRASRLHEGPELDAMELALEERESKLQVRWGRLRSSQAEMHAVASTMMIIDKEVTKIAASSPELATQWAGAKPSIAAK